MGEMICWSEIRRGECKLEGGITNITTFKPYPNASNQPVYIELIACAQTSDDTRTYTFHAVPCTLPACAWLPINAHRCSNAYPNFMLVTTGERAPIPSNVWHFGHGHFGLGRFGPDISA